MYRVAVDDAEGVTVAPGIVVKTLWGSPGGPRCLAIDWDKGSQWPGDDVHDGGPEIVYIAEGGVEEGDVTLRRGDIAVYPKDSSHSPRSEAGCRMIVFYPEG